MHSLNHLLADLDGNKVRETQPRTTILLRDKTGWHHVKLERIIYCTTVKQGTVFRLSDNNTLHTDHSLKHFERLLRQYGFIKIHQSVLINYAHLARVAKINDRKVAVMRDGTILLFGKNKFRPAMNELQNQALGGKIRLKGEPVLLDELLNSIAPETGAAG